MLNKSYRKQSRINYLPTLFWLLIFVSTRAVIADPIDFILPTLDGSRFVHLSETKRPVLINFWGVECPSCVAELPMLEQFSKAHTQWTVLLIATDTAHEVHNFLAHHPVSLPILQTKTNAINIMRLFGNRFGALPFSVAINNKEQICWHKLGALDKLDLAKLKQDC